MSKVCTACGLTTDDAGNLIAAVSGVFPYTAACGESGGGKVYCSPTDGKLYVDPPPMYREWRFVNEIPTVPANGNGELTNYGVSEAEAKPAVKSFTGAGGVITNPSACRSMMLFIEIGVQHALFTVDSGGASVGDTALGDLQVDAAYSLSGAITAANQQGGHFHWGAQANGGGGQREIFRMDSTGAFLDLPSNANGTSPFVLPAGASVTVTPISTLTVIRYTTTGSGSVRLENWRTTIRVRGWAGA